MVIFSIVKDRDLFPGNFRIVRQFLPALTAARADHGHFPATLRAVQPQTRVVDERFIAPLAVNVHLMSAGVREHDLSVCAETG